MKKIPFSYFNECNTISLQEGDILLGMDGKKEFRASYVDKEIADVAVNQRVAIIRVDRKKISPEYIFLALVSKLGQKQLFAVKTQTATVGTFESLVNSKNSYSENKRC